MGTTGGVAAALGGGAGGFGTLAAGGDGLALALGFGLTIPANRDGSQIASLVPLVAERVAGRVGAAAGACLGGGNASGPSSSPVLGAIALAGTTGGGDVLAGGINAFFLATGAGIGKSSSISGAEFCTFDPAPVPVVVLELLLLLPCCGAAAGLRPERSATEGR